MFYYRVRVMVFNATTNNFQLYCGDSFYWWSKPEVSLENMVVERRDHILLYKNIPINMSSYDNLFKYEYICNVLFFFYLPTPSANYI